MGSWEVKGVIAIVNFDTPVRKLITNIRGSKARYCCVLYILFGIVG
jgi:hypothetical protein